jgi:hypothetical protein
MAPTSVASEAMRCAAVVSGCRPRHPTATGTALKEL